jgi:hypothetical protein
MSFTIDYDIAISEYRRMGSCRKVSCGMLFGGAVREVIGKVAGDLSTSLFFKSDFSATLRRALAKA